MEDEYKNKFKVGDCVFAKVTGHPFWPAVITSVDKANSIIRYNVSFYGTGEIANGVKELHICSFLENRNKYTGAKVVKNKDKFSKAVKEAIKYLNYPHSSPLSAQPSPNTSLASGKKCSSSTKCQLILPETPVSSATSQNVDDSVPPHFDLATQLDSVTDKCISLHKSLIEEQELNAKLNGTIINLQRTVEQNSEDFHTKILKQELQKYKLENKSLLLSLEMLQNENSTLQADLARKNNFNPKCLHCFPSMKVSDVSPPASDKAPIPRAFLPRAPVPRPAKPRVYKNNLMIFADSHGRDIGNMVEMRSSTRVSSSVMPGACLGSVVKDCKRLCSNLSNKDHILVMGGTNDIGPNCGNQIFRHVKTLINDTLHTNIILATVPMRYDTSQLDLKILTVNLEIEKIAGNYSNVNILPLHLLPKHCFNKGGIHFNKKGKEFISSMISRILLSIDTVSSKPISSKTLQLHQKDINVIDINMSEVMDELKHDPSVGFAHTISADLEHHRHMSGGVAVIFRNKFSRPDFSHYIDSRLTHQRIPHGASIFSLVTKPNFYGKPTSETYNTSFKQLTHNFKSLGLKTLVCSPMGCVRDNIGLDLLAKNIVSFQKETNSIVYIVSYCRESTRVLRSGLSHSRFLEELRMKIAQETMSSESSIPLPGLTHTDSSASTSHPSLNLPTTPTQQPTLLTQSPGVRPTPPTIPADSPSPLQVSQPSVVSPSQCESDECSANSNVSVLSSPGFHNRPLNHV